MTNSEARKRAQERAGLCQCGEPGCSDAGQQPTPARDLRADVAPSPTVEDYIRSTATANGIDPDRVVADWRERAAPEPAPVETAWDVIARYFDLDADPWDDHDAACPAPEDLWRLHRDLRIAREGAPE